MAAHISACGKYRYSLRRGFADCDKVLFIGVNPSTADASLDDATVRKWTGFTKRWGYAGYSVVNLFAYRSTDVKALASAEDPVGPLTDWEIKDAMSRAQLIVPCWGDSGKLPPALRGRIATVTDMLRDCDASIRVFGLTKSGDPKHPLMLGYDTQLTEWRLP